MKNRQRGRNNGKPRPGGGGGGGQNRGFDGNNSGRMRGNAQQLMEKYLAMARDATTAGDRVLAENYFQHADHYYRVLNARFEQQQQNGQHNNQNNGQRPYQGNDRGYDGDYQGQDPQGQGGQGYQQQPQQNYQQPQQHQPQHHQQHQPQQSYQPPQQNQPQAQPHAQPHAPSHEGDIGLPPGILGMAPESAPQTQQSDRGEQGGESAEAVSERPAGRHGRRRRGPPRERAAAADANAE